MLKWGWDTKMAELVNFTRFGWLSILMFHDEVVIDSKE